MRPSRADSPRAAGIDVGTRRAAYCSLSARGQNFDLWHMKSFAVKGDDILDRIENLAMQLIELLEEDRPAIVAVEDGYVGRNPRTSLTLGMARGVAAFTAKSSTNAEVHLVDPGEARKAIGVARFGQGRAAAKSAVIVAVSRILCLTASAPDEDEADAAALAVWAANRLWQLNAITG